MQPEELRKDLNVNRPLHGRDPLEVKSGRRNPADFLEFPGAFKVDDRVGLDEFGEHIMLFLPVETIFLSIPGKEVPIRTDLGNDSVSFGGETEFFFHLALNRGDESFARLATALGKLPATGVVAALAEKNLPGGIAENEGDIGSIGRHGKKIMKDEG